MILCDHQISKLLLDGALIIDPTPDESQIQSTAIDLRVGDDFLRWNQAHSVSGVSTHIDLDSVDLAELRDFMTPLEPENGVIKIKPKDFVLVRTLEDVCLPLKSKLAARVEGRSKQARLGMGVHVTAPTIHAGFKGKITLEIVNHGPFTLLARPNHSKLCQLIIERVAAVPRKHGGKFLGQTTPLGTPMRQPKR